MDKDFIKSLIPYFEEWITLAILKYPEKMGGEARTRAVMDYQSKLSEIIAKLKELSA